MTKRLSIVGAPSSAGAYAPGQEKAPEALRSGGLIERLTAVGIEVEDRGDVRIWRWRPDRDSPLAQNADQVAETALATAAKVEQAVLAGEAVLVLGGDCTVELGTVAGHLRCREDIGLIYFDVHADANVPDSVPDGALDWMGVAHLLGETGAVPEVSRIGPRYPLLAPDQVLMFGLGPNHTTQWESEVVARRGLDVISADAVAVDPAGAARDALEIMEARFDRLLIHFDVDTIDFTDAPLAENTSRNSGLSFDAAMQALKGLLGSTKLSAITVTEVNPDHGEEDGSTLDRFLDGLVEGLRPIR